MYIRFLQQLSQCLHYLVGSSSSSRGKEYPLKNKRVESVYMSLCKCSYDYNDQLDLRHETKQSYTILIVQYTVGCIKMQAKQRISENRPIQNGIKIRQNSVFQKIGRSKKVSAARLLSLYLFEKSLKTDEVEIN